MRINIAIKTPAFWKERNLYSRIFLPLSLIYYLCYRIKLFFAKPYNANVITLCVGNAVAGGAGKTPVAIAIVKALSKKGMSCYFLSGGYGGSESGPLIVDPLIHNSKSVGDEPLMLAKIAPVCVAKNKAAGLARLDQLSASRKIDIVVIDDGLQNGNFTKKISILVLDGEYGLGNGYLLPAGPMRQSLKSAILASDLVVLIDKDRHELLKQIPFTTKVIHAKTKILNGDEFLDKKVVAFAGIANPDKLFTSLANSGANIVDRIAFADHYNYKKSDLIRLLACAKKHHALLVTTEKDLARIPRRHQHSFKTLKIETIFSNPIDEIICTKLGI